MASKNPTLLDVVNKSAEKERLDIHTALPGRVASFNAEQNTVAVEGMIVQVLANGQSSELPPLTDVPVQYPRGGGFVMTFPIKAGDEGLIVFNERCIDGWWASGQKSVPLDARMHDYSDAVFIPGISSLKNVISDVFKDGVSMQTDDGETYIRLTQGKILIKGAIEHEGNTIHKGNWNQMGGNSESDGTFTAKKVIANGVDTETHTHSGVQSGGSNTGVPNK